MQISQQAVHALAMQAPTKPHVKPLPTNIRPNHTHIKTLRLEISKYAKSYDSMLGGGAHGHITIICRPATTDYALLTNNAAVFAQPLHPGAPPQFIAGTTNVVMNNQKGAYNYALKNFNDYTAAYEAILAKLIEVGHKWVEPLNHPDTGFNQVAPHQIMAHLYTNYGQLRPFELTANENKLTQPWNPDTEQIEDLITRLSHCQQIAQLTDPISDQKLVRSGLQVIKQTDKFADAVRLWGSRTPAQQTWPEFQTFWTNQFLSYLETRENINPNLTTQQAGFSATDSCLPVGFTPPKKLIFFCWSHGLGDDPTHTSGTCKFPAAGHQRAATLDDMMGGNPRIRTGKPTIYKPPQHILDRLNKKNKQEEKKDE